LLLSLKTLQPLFLSMGINLEIENEAHLPVRLLILAAVLLCVGAGLVFRRRSGRS
jgi:hypothetical protein